MIRDLPGFENLAGLLSVFEQFKRRQVIK